MDKNVVRATMTDQAYEIIKNRIIKGDYKADDKLTETGMAKNLNLSPTPVREAFNRLVSEGYLVSIPYKGVFVKSYDYDDVKQAYLIRAQLQGLAMRFLLEKIDDEEMAEFEDLLDAGLKNTEAHIFYRFFDFQKAIFSKSRSKVIISSISPLDAIINVDRLTHVSEKPDSDRICNLFISLMDAMTERNVDEAVSSIEEIVGISMDIALRNIDEFIS
ncbi:GntR family transcriptional regulator [Acidaminobacter sp. JC074]|uniref:GntR family transcriptional regulator n=1 Tax=Acidaminobacter sp. JC074 TaxID=2530199 RepID=UPI001F0D3121